MLLSLFLHGDAGGAGGLFGYDAPRLHAVLNDFPPALLVVGMLFELAYLFTRRESLRSAAYWSLVVGAASTAVALFSGLRAEDAIEHGQAIHDIMEAHERFAWITLGCFSVVAVWRLLRETKMGRGERWGAATLGLVGLVFLVATGREGGELVFDHAAGISTEAMEAELENRAAGHEHAEGEAHDETMPAAAGDVTDSIADGGDTAVGVKTPHTHAPGTPDHQD